MDISSPPASSSAPSKASFKPCATCHLPAVSPWVKYKNCIACREVNRMKKKEADERKLARQKFFAKVVQLDRTPSDEDDLHLAMTAATNKPTKTTIAKTPRVSISGYDEDIIKGPVLSTSHTIKATKTTTSDRPIVLIKKLEGEDKPEALMEMKNRLKTTIQPEHDVKVNATGTSNWSPEGKEYQTASALYDSLKCRMQKCQAAKTKLNFNGYHAIVSVSNIDHLARVQMVLTDMRKIVRLPFGHTKTEHVRSFETGSQTVVMQCSCLGQEAIIPTLKGNKGDLIKRARGSGLTKPRICGGKVFITAVDDTTHPHVLGQRIIVRIEHN